METLHSFRNNEILTGIAILSVLKNIKKLNIALCLLIEPILSYKSVRDYLKSNKCKIRSIEELIVKQSVAFSNFNCIFQENLPLSINSILLLSELKLIKIENNNIIFTGEKFDFNEKTLGKASQNLILASKNLSKIFKEGDVSSLYLGLRIEL